MATQLTWDNSVDRVYETGVKKGVLYNEPLADNKGYGNGVAWNGLTSVSESPSGAEETALYADDIKYLSLRSAEEFGATIEAYTYPDEWMACDGSADLGGIDGVAIGQQSRGKFGLCYRTIVGNDEKGNDFGYKLHLIYGGTASPSERSYQTVNDSPEAITFSWEITTTPVPVGKVGEKDHKPTACLTIDTTRLKEGAKAKLAELEAILYGMKETEDSTTEAPKYEDARLPLPAEVYSILSAA